MKDKFWNFVFYKFIFVFGVVNVQYLNEVILWVSWFSVLGFLHLLSQLSKDRFEYVSRVACAARCGCCKVCELSPPLFFVAVVLLDHDPGLVALQAGRPSLRHSDALRNHVHHINRRWPVRGHQYVRLHGGRGEWTWTIICSVRARCTGREMRARRPLVRSAAPPRLIDRSDRVAGKVTGEAATATLAVAAQWH